MEDLVLSIEQCKHLQKLGLDMSDAKLWWAKEGHLYPKFTEKALVPLNKIPTYTLQEILEKLPSRKDWHVLQLDMYVRYIGYYHVNPELEKYRTTNYTPYTLWEEGDDKSILESAYKLLCWTIEKGYLKVK